MHTLIAADTDPSDNREDLRVEQPTPLTADEQRRASERDADVDVVRRIQQQTLETATARRDATGEIYRWLSDGGLSPTAARLLALAVTRQP